MPKHFNTIKKEISFEDKKERLKVFLDFGYSEKDIKNFSSGCNTIDDFLNKTIYEESVLMKCTKCSYKELIDFDMISGLWDESISDYPEFECPKCGHKKSSGVLIPIDIFNKINNM